MRAGYNISWGSYNKTYEETLALLYPTDMSGIQTIHADYPSSLIPFEEKLVLPYGMCKVRKRF